MPRYSPLARLRDVSGELYDTVEAINDKLDKFGSEYVIFHVVGDDEYVITRADDNGPWEILADADVYEQGDEYEATDAVAEYEATDAVADAVGEEYIVLGNPYGGRHIAYDHES